MSGRIFDVERRYSVGEVAELVGVKEHTIRFWTAEFSHIKYIKGLGNRRYYKIAAVRQMQEIRFLMKERHLSISDIKALLPKGSGDKRRSPLFLLEARPDAFAKLGSLFNGEVASPDEVYKRGSGKVSRSDLLEADFVQGSSSPASYGGESLGSGLSASVGGLPSDSSAAYGAGSFGRRFGSSLGVSSSGRSSMGFYGGEAVDFGATYSGSKFASVGDEGSFFDEGRGDELCRSCGKPVGGDAQIASLPLLLSAEVADSGVREGNSSSLVDPFVVSLAAGAIGDIEEIEETIGKAGLLLLLD